MARTTNKKSAINSPKKRGGELPGRKRNRLFHLSDNARWVVGLVLFFFAVYLLWICVSYFFTWGTDSLPVGWSGGQDEPTSAADAVPTGEKGSLGVMMARAVVGRGFGFFAVGLPLIIAVISLRLMRFRPMALERSVRLALSVMILGSVTLGLTLGTRWGIFGTGAGGELGIRSAEWLRGAVGMVGGGLALLCLWILLAVYVSRKNISRVNRVGRAIADGGVRVGEIVSGRKMEFASDGEEAERDGVHDENTTQSADNDVYYEQDEEWGDGSGKRGIWPFRGRRNKPSRDSAEEEYDESDVRAGDGSIAVDRTTGEILNGAAAGAAPPAAGVNRLTINDMAARAAGMHTGQEPGGSEGSMTATPIDGEAHPVGAGGVGSLGVPMDVERPGGGYGDEDLTMTQGVENQSPFEVHDLGESYATAVGSQPREALHPRVVRTPDGIFEVMELDDAGYDCGGGVMLGAGGVVTSDDGEAMEVLQAARRDAELEEDDIERRLYDPLRELSTYRRPEIEGILANHGTRVEVSDDEIQVNSNRIVQTLRNFGIEISKIKATIGPTVTLYEIIPAPGVKISKIKGLEQDIALSLKALGIRIIAPMPGKGTIGIEVPNQNREVVSMYSLVKSVKFQESTAELPLVLGKTIQNETFLVDLAKMPHLLIAGATGQGKSVGLNVIISSLLYKKHPAEVKFVMVDPKKVELSLFSRLEKHFLAKMESEDDAILTDTQKVVYTLNSLCGEMEARYELLRKAEVKKISEYNEKFVNRRLNPKRGHRYLPYIVVVIDEFADMIMTAGKEVEHPITRLAQLARATGIHLIIATQRPDVKVITGLIKANFPARIAFRVTSIVDSRTILDQTGANQLIGQGDMLISLNGEITRLQCAFIDTPEIERMTQFIQDQRGYANAYALPDYVPEGSDGSSSGDLGDVDRMFEEVARFVVANQQGSTSNIQRHFAIGYNRAGRLMDQLERAGIVGRAEGSKPREVLIQDPRSLERIFEDLGLF